MKFLPSRIAILIALTTYFTDAVVGPLPTADTDDGCRPIYVRWSRVKLSLPPAIRGRYSLEDCRRACTDGRHPARSGLEPLACAGFSHRRGPSDYEDDCQIYQTDQLQIMDGHAQADERYSFYWKYCVKTNVRSSCASSADHQFSFHSDRYMDPGEVTRRLVTASLPACLGLCLNEPTFACRSVSYNRTDGGCHLSPQSMLSKPRLIRLNNNPNFRIDYYESNCHKNSFTFTHECRPDGVVVRVASTFAYTGALYGLYDYFTCRTQPTERHNFSLFLPAPGLSTNCSDSVRLKGNYMMLEVVLSTDGVEPLYFITPEDLTYQAKCPMVSKNSIESSIDLPPINSRARTALNSAATTGSISTLSSPAAITTISPEAATAYQAPAWVDPRDYLLEEVSRRLRDRLRLAASTTTNISATPTTQDTPVTHNSTESSVVVTYTIAQASSKPRQTTRPSSTDTTATLSAPTSHSPSGSTSLTYNSSSRKLTEKTTNLPDLQRSTSVLPTPNDTTSKSTGAHLIQGTPRSIFKTDTVIGSTLFPRGVTKLTTQKSTSKTDTAFVRTSTGDDTMVTTVRQAQPTSTAPRKTSREWFRQTTRTSAPRWTNARQTTTAASSDVPELPPKLSTTTTLATEGTRPTTESTTFTATTSRPRTTSTTTPPTSTPITTATTTTTTTTTRRPSTTTTPVKTTTSTSTTRTSTRSTSVTTKPRITATPSTSTSTPVTTTTRTLPTTTSTPTTTTRTLPTTTSTTTLQTTTRTLATTTLATTTRTLATTTLATTTTPPLTTRGPTTTKAPPAPIHFEIFNGAQPVEAVVVGSRITLSFTSAYQIPAKYMTIARCQIEPIGSLYDWEKEPLPIVDEGCQADNVGLVCPPERTQTGIRVRVESFRYQTTAQVQYSCVVRVCPFSPCRQAKCASVEGCAASALLRGNVARGRHRRRRAKRQLTLAELQQALIQNPDLQRQLNLLPPFGAVAAPTPAPGDGHEREDWRRRLAQLGGEHRVTRRLIVVNSDRELQYFFRTGTVPGDAQWGRR